MARFALRVGPETEVAFALVPYLPDDQPAGTTERQVALIDGPLGDRRWGVCTECGMARAEREEIRGCSTSIARSWARGWSRDAREHGRGRRLRLGPRAVTLRPRCQPIYHRCYIG